MVHFAAVTAPNLAPAGSVPNSGQSISLTGAITNVATSVIEVLLVVGGALAVIYLIWAGIQYITSAGSPDKAKAARGGIVNAIIGIIVIMAAFFIIRLAITAGRDVACSDKQGTNCSASTTQSSSKPTP